MAQRIWAYISAESWWITAEEISCHIRGIVSGLKELMNPRSNHIRYQVQGSSGMAVSMFQDCCWPIRLATCHMPGTKAAVNMSKFEKDHQVCLLRRRKMRCFTWKWHEVTLKWFVNTKCSPDSRSSTNWVRVVCLQGQVANYVITSKECWIKSYEEHPSSVKCRCSSATWKCIVSTPRPISCKWLSVPALVTWMWAG